MTVIVLSKGAKVMNVADGVQIVSSDMNSTPDLERWATGWQSLGGVLSSDPCVVRNADGRLEVLAVGQDCALWHIRQNRTGWDWSEWCSLGGSLTGNVSAVLHCDGRLWAFARGADGGLWYIHQTIPGGDWSDGYLRNDNANPLTTDPVAKMNANGVLEVFAGQADNAVWHSYQKPGGWSDWYSLAGQTLEGETHEGQIFPAQAAQLENGSNISVAAGFDGHLEIFARFSENAPYRIWQTSPGGGWNKDTTNTYHQWKPVSFTSKSSTGPDILLTILITSDPVAAENADGHLEVFALGADHALWHTWQDLVTDFPWQKWSPLGGHPNGKITVARNFDGRLEVFATWETGGPAWHMHQLSIAGGWSQWASLGGQIEGTMACACNRDGRLEVFARGPAGAIWRRWQIRPGGRWN